MRETTRSLAFLLSVVLAACAPQAQERDPAVHAAKRACTSLPESERHDQLFPATTENGPDVFPTAES